MTQHDESRGTYCLTHDVFYASEDGTNPTMEQHIADNKPCTIVTAYHCY